MHSIKKSFTFLFLSISSLGGSPWVLFTGASVSCFFSRSRLFLLFLANRYFYCTFLALLVVLVVFLVLWSGFSSAFDCWSPEGLPERRHLLHLAIELQDFFMRLSSFTQIGGPFARNGTQLRAKNDKVCTIDLVLFSQIAWNFECICLRHSQTYLRYFCRFDY